MRNDVVANLIVRVDRMFEECRDKLKKTVNVSHMPIYQAKLCALTACRDVLKNPHDSEKLNALKTAREEAMKSADRGANGKLTLFEKVSFKDSDVVDMMMTVIYVIEGKNQNILSITPTANAPF